jgi:hypothetical protein
MSVDRDGCSDLLIGWLPPSLLIIGIMLILFSFVSYRVGGGEMDYGVTGFSGLLLTLFGAAAIERRRRSQAAPDLRARRADFLRLRQEGLLVGQPDLAKELGVKSATVRRWCKALRLEPAYRVGRNYFTLQQAELVRRYGSAGTTERREILEELEDRPFVVRPTDCTACGAWNPPGSQRCGECGTALGKVVQKGDCSANSAGV